MALLGLARKCISSLKAEMPDIDLVENRIDDLSDAVECEREQSITIIKLGYLTRFLEKNPGERFSNVVLIDAGNTYVNWKALSHSVKSIRLANTNNFENELRFLIRMVALKSSVTIRKINNSDVVN